MYDLRSQDSDESLELGDEILKDKIRMYGGSLG